MDPKQIIWWFVKKHAEQEEVSSKTGRANSPCGKKGPADLVTEVDVASQRAIAAVIRDYYPDHRVIGEEDHP